MHPSLAGGGDGGGAVNVFVIIIKLYVFYAPHLCPLPLRGKGECAAEHRDSIGLLSSLSPGREPVPQSGRPKVRQITPISISNSCCCFSAPPPTPPPVWEGREKPVVNHSFKHRILIPGDKGAKNRENSIGFSDPVNTDGTQPGGAGIEIRRTGVGDYKG